MDPIPQMFTQATTQFWGKPLEKAVYTFTIPEKMDVDSFSYVPDTMSMIPNKKLYIWEKYDFSPRVDFDITLKRN